MSQADFDVANQGFPAFRADLNAQLVALGSTSKGPTAPASPQSGQLWIDDNTPSATVWTLNVFDGTDWIEVGLIDSTDNRFLPYGGVAADRDAKTANYTVVAADRGRILDCSGTITITLIAAATAGQGWGIAIRNAGTGTVTIDGNAAETINGSGTYTLGAKESVLLVCDGTNWIVVAEARKPFINVRDYGATGNSIGGTDGAITSGTPDFTSASAAFIAADVGKTITVAGAGASSATLVTTISAFVSATAVTLAANAGTTVSAADYSYGTDDTQAFKDALAAAGDAEVFVPTGSYTISDNIDNGFTGNTIRLVGAVPANRHFISNVSSSTFDDDFIALVGGQFPIIKCVDTNFIGATDTGVAFNASTKLKVFKNIFAYGVGAAEIGLHIVPNGTIIEGCTFAIFDLFGVLLRKGTTSSFENLSFYANGSGLAESGTISGNNWGSGCGLKINADDTPQNYHTIVGAERPTTLALRNIFFWSKGGYATGYSGMRGIQAHGLIGGSFDGVASEQGWYLRTCTDIGGSQFWIENWENHGLANADNTPYELYAYDTQMHFKGKATNLGAQSANTKGFVTERSGAAGVTAQNTYEIAGELRADHPIRSEYQITINTLTPGGTNTYTFTKMLPDGKLSGLSHAGRAFFGSVFIFVQKKADLADWSIAKWAIAKWKAGAVYQTWEAASADHAQDNSGAGYEITIAAVRSNGENLEVDITWGTSRATGVDYYITAGLLGGGARSS